VVSVILRFVIGALDEAGGTCGLRIGALDETGQQKAGDATAGVKRQYIGCAGRVANGINTVLVMAALAVCVTAAAQAHQRTDTQAPPPASPDDLPPADPGLIPLTVAEIKRLFNAATARPRAAWHAARWSRWRRRHQARARWHHKRARLGRQPQFAKVKP
jgi:DDE superfamily endonuclease